MYGFCCMLLQKYKSSVIFSILEKLSRMEFVKNCWFTDIKGSIKELGLRQSRERSE
jgi:hypothetical protein